MAFRCKVCKDEFETEQGIELHRIAHQAKNIDRHLLELIKFFEQATSALKKSAS